MINYKLLKACITKRGNRYYFNSPDSIVVSNPKHSRRKFMAIITQWIQWDPELSIFKK